MKKTLRIAAFASALLLASACGDGFEYSDGFRVGVVQKFSQKGLIWKTWEGELVMDGVRTRGENGLTNVWGFSGPKDLPQSVISVIIEAQNTGRRVRIRYVEHVAVGPSFGNTTYHITGAELL